jgi:hypothetical protein
VVCSTPVLRSLLVSYKAKDLIQVTEEEISLDEMDDSSSGRESFDLEDLCCI